MSRPKDLPTVLQAWAAGSYSAGPAWGGTAKRQIGAQTELTPGTTLPAELGNYLHGNGFDAAQGALTMGGQAPALNWLPAVALTGLKRAAYSAKDNAWWATGDAANDTLQRTADGGRSWAAPGGLASAYSTQDIAFDASGNGVIVGTTVNLYSGLWTAYGAITWTAVAGGFSGALGDARVAYDATNAKWIVVSRIGALSGFRLFSSANRTTWTAQTQPAAWSAYAGANSNAAEIGVNPAGVALACFVDSTPALNVMKSTDGGTTWANVVVSLAATMAPTAYSRPVWSATDATWYIAVSQGSARKTQIYSSTDGVTWSTAANYQSNDIALQDIDVLGSLLVGVNDDGRVAISTNKGVTWYWAGVATVAGLAVNKAWLRAGGGGLLAVHNVAGKVVHSMRYGFPSQAV